MTVPQQQRELGLTQGSLRVDPYGRCVAVSTDWGVLKGRVRVPERGLGLTEGRLEVGMIIRTIRLNGCFYKLGPLLWVSL